MKYHGCVSLEKYLIYYKTKLHDLHKKMILNYRDFVGQEIIVGLSTVYSQFYIKYKRKSIFFVNNSPLETIL